MKNIEEINFKEFIEKKNIRHMMKKLLQKHTQTYTKKNKNMKKHKSILTTFNIIS